MRITDHRVIDTALNDAGGITADAAGICMSIDRLHVIEGFQLIQIEVFQIQRIFFCGCVDSAAIYTFDNTAEILAADAAGILFTAHPLLLPTTLGSILGAFTAVDIQAAVLQKMIGGLLVVMFFMILLDPNTWVKSNIEKAKARHPWVRFLIFLGIGFYGGFIQIGVGFFMLGGLVLGCGYDLLKANALKVLLILIYTFGALVIFIWYDLVDWRTGLILACGNMAGAWIGTRLSVKWGAKYIRYILLLALVMVALKLFGIF